MIYICQALFQFFIGTISSNPKDNSMRQMLLFLHLDEMYSSAETLSWEWRTGMLKHSLFFLVPLCSAIHTTVHCPVFSILLGPSKADLVYGPHWRFLLASHLWLGSATEENGREEGRCIYFSSFLPVKWSLAGGLLPSKITTSVGCHTPLSTGKPLPCPHPSGSPGNCTSSLHDQENSKAIGASGCLYNPKIDCLLKFHGLSSLRCPWFLIIQCATCFLGTLANTYSNYKLLLTHACCLNV